MRKHSAGGSSELAPRISFAIAAIRIPWTGLNSLTVSFISNILWRLTLKSWILPEPAYHLAHSLIQPGEKLSPALLVSFQVILSRKEQIGTSQPY
jgi:hypothetical protein